MAWGGTGALTGPGSSFLAISLSPAEFGASPGPWGPLTVPPQLSLTICCSALRLLPTSSLTSDKKLGDVALVGGGSLPASLLPAPRWASIWGAWGFLKHATARVLLHFPRGGT